MPEPTPVRAPGPASQDRTQDGTHDSQPAGRDRLLSALRSRGSRGQAVVGLLLAVLGFAAAVQLRVNDQSDSFTGARQADLIALIGTLSLATDRAEAEIRDLELTRDASTQRHPGQADRAGPGPDPGWRRSASWPAPSRRPDPASRITVRTPVGRGRPDHAAQRHRGAARRRRRGHRDQRHACGSWPRPASEDPTRAGHRRRRGRPATAATSSTRSATPHTLARAVDFDGGFTDDVEQGGGTVDRPGARRCRDRLARSPTARPTPSRRTRQ